jgi:hypothetical protein
MLSCSISCDLRVIFCIRCFAYVFSSVCIYFVQLVERVNLLRQGLVNNTITDEDFALAATLREISALENGLLQANNDAMRLATRIVNQLNPKKQNSNKTAVAGGSHS